ncbi:hypothetical protein AURDEDRAFT_185615 [Auricularia subglabra TFB-10046 SS5]|nr:hypothetical protein AURDEDRAFT_185615 [Auricularia subglabra TFB-10046 SS5]
MDDDEADDRDIDLLANRILDLERRRALQSFEYSFSREVGSSSALPDDESDVSEELPDGAYDDDDEELANLYEQYIQEMNANPESSEEDSMMCDGLPEAQHGSLFAQCPACRVAWCSRDAAASNGTFVCPQCRLALPLADIASAWHAEHGAECDPKHALSLAVLPDGLLLLCGAAACDWTFDL